MVPVGSFVEVDVAGWQMLMTSDNPAGIFSVFIWLSAMMVSGETENFAAILSKVSPTCVVYKISLHPAFWVAVLGKVGVAVGRDMSGIGAAIFCRPSNLGGSNGE